MSSLTAGKPLTVAIAGNPNSGKTTLFNRLTGLRQKVANYPGVTVEKKIGVYPIDGTNVQLVDLPGTYGLSPKSEEERIAAEVIQGCRPHLPPLRGVLVVVDATCLERSLYLVMQIIETGVRAAVLLNMCDELQRRRMKIDGPELAKRLGVPVFSISATQGLGVKSLRDQIHEWISRPADFVPAQKVPVPGMADVIHRRTKSKEICQAVITEIGEGHTFSDRVDRLMMHRIWGPLIFAGVVILVFQSIFTGAQPLMDGLDAGFQQLAGQVSILLPDGLFESFLVNGVIAGVGSVIVFLPQILIVFFFISILENSGYLARAAMVMDRFMSKVGLQGKSFLPLISSFACAIPGVMSARTIENRRDRIATIMVAPFMTCSARLPVYALLIGAFIPETPIVKGILGARALTLMGLYVAGFIGAIGMAWVLKSSVLKSDKTPFLLDVPPYRFPPMKSIVLLMWDRSKIFLRRAGTIILGVTIVLWFLASFPRANGSPNVENSFAGKIGHVIEPVIKPLGFNWRIGVGLLSAQAAREVIVSSLATIYQVEGSQKEPQGLQKALRNDLTPLAAVSLLIFFVFAMQCASTMAVIRRETGGWKIPIAVFLTMNMVAYIASFVVFQGGKALGF